MNSLKNLSNEELDQSLQSLVQTERQTLGVILLHLKEVHRRKLYLKLGFGSLFDYLTKHLKYSAGSAQRRIDACRLSEAAPELIESLEKGDLNLAQVSLVQRSFREKEREEEVGSLGFAERNKDRELLSRSKQVLVHQLKNKSLAESEMIVAKALDLSIKAESKLKFQADESVRLEITLNQKQWQKLNQMRELISHSVPHGSWNQVLEFVAERVINSKTKARSPEGNSFSVLRKRVLQRDRCCQYRDPKTQRHCASVWRLQVDHIRPRWAGGQDEISNLRALCGKHNRELYREQSGIRN
jgi:hypothetical protein